MMGFPQGLLYLNIRNKRVRQATDLGAFGFKSPKIYFRVVRINPNTFTNYL